MASIAIQSAASIEDLDPEDASLEKLKHERRKEAFSSIKWGSALVLLHIPLVIFKVVSFGMIFRSILLVVGLLALCAGLWELRQARKLTLEGLNAHREAEKFAKSIEKTKTTYTKAVAGCLIVVAVFQLFTGRKESIQAAGLVKNAVREGEFWRLLTCATLHAGFMHIWMNCQALMGFGKLIEGLTNRAYIIIVFLVSALCGSLFSLILMPNATSVGASGGLMGLVGFLAVFGYKRRESVPAGFFKSMLINIGFIGVLGLAGFAIIDNAAHFGGLMAGAASGAILIRKDGESSREHKEVINLLGILSMLMIAGISILSIIMMLK